MNTDADAGTDATAVNDTILVVRREEGVPWLVGGETTTVKVSEVGGGSELLVLENSAPPGGGPALARHRFVEAFHVLEGEVEFATVGADGQEQIVTAGVGDTAVIPSLAWHRYRNVGSGPARLLAMFDSRVIDRIAALVGQRLDAPAGSAAPDPEAMAALLPILREHRVEQHAQAVAAGTAVTPEQPVLRMVRAGEGEHWLVAGEVSTVKVCEDEPSGRLLVVENTLDLGVGPAMGRHRFIEAFHVLEGEVEFSVLGADAVEEVLRAEVGDTVYVPSLAWHGYRNAAQVRARMLSIFATTDVVALGQAIGQRLTDVEQRPEPAMPSPEGTEQAVEIMGRLGIETPGPGAAPAPKP